MVRCVWDSPTWQQAPLNVKLAMIAGAAMEGGVCGEAGTGDNGCSFGPYQINTCGGVGGNVKGAGAECWQDAECATRTMLGRYTSCARSHTNPIDIAFCAEGPQHYYGAAQIAAAMAAISRATGGASNPPTPIGQPSPGDIVAMQPGLPNIPIPNIPRPGDIPGIGGAITSAKDAIFGAKDILDLLKKVFGALADPETYERASIGFIGVSLVLVGGAILAFNAIGGTDTVIKLIPAGRAASAARAG